MKESSTVLVNGQCGTGGGNGGGGGGGGAGGGTGGGTGGSAAQLAQDSLDARTQDHGSAAQSPVDDALGDLV